MDLVFVLDSSGSVPHEAWELLLDFVIGIVQSLLIDQRHARVGLVTFSTVPRSDIHLNEYEQKDELISAIRQVQKIPGFTDIESAILLTYRDYFNISTLDIGDRKNIMVLILDGVATQNYRLAVLEASFTSLHDIEIIAIYISDNIFQEQARWLSSPPHQLNENYFIFDNYTLLVDSTDLISRVICDAAPPG